MNIKFVKGENELKGNNKEITNLLKEKNLYQFKIDNMSVNMIYSKNDKSFKDCMLNILKQKAQWADIYYWARYTIKEER